MLMRMKARQGQRGFTLVELMIVVAIIGILMAIAIPNFIAYRTRGANSAAKSEASNFYTAAVSQVADTGTSATFNSSTIPSGFARNPEITISGTLSVYTSSNTVSGNPTFVHARGTTTYTIQSDGGISPSGV